MSRVLFAALVLMTGTLSNPAPVSATSQPVSFQVSAAQFNKADLALLDEMYKSLNAFNLNEADSILSDLVLQNPEDKTRVRALIYRFVDYEYPPGSPPGGWPSVYELQLKWLQYLLDQRINVQAVDYQKISAVHNYSYDWQKSLSAANTGLSLKPSPRTEVELYYLQTEALLGLHQPDQALKNLDKIKALLQKLYTSDKYVRENYADDALSLTALTFFSDYSSEKRPFPAFDKKQTEVETFLVTQALKLSPHFDLAYARQSRLFRYANNYQQALVSINKAIQLAPGNYKHYDDRAQILYMLKSPAAALKDYQKALQMLENIRRQRLLDELEQFNYDFIQRNIKRIKAYG